MTSTFALGEKILANPLVRATLQDICVPRGSLGLGLKVAKASWSSPQTCYVQITRAEMGPRGRLHLWGEKYWNGAKVEEEKRIGGQFKKNWVLVEPEAVVPRRMKQMERSLERERQSREAAAAAAAEAAEA